MTEISLPSSEVITPCAPEAEASVLSAIFIDGLPSINACIQGNITSKAFFIVENRIIFQTMLELHADNKPITVDVVMSELKRKDEWDRVGFPHLMAVSAKVPTTAELPYHIERVRDTYIARELIASCEKTIDLARKGGATVETYTQEVDRLLSIQFSTKRVKTIQSATDEAIARAERIVNKSEIDEDIGLNWPWLHVTEQMGPAAPGQLIILAARPGGGKSSFLRQALDFWATRYGHVALFSREMMVDELPPLFVQMRTGVSWRLFKKRELPGDKVKLFMEGLREFRQLKTLHVFDKERTLSQVIARAKSFAQTHKTMSIGIDYLQRYDPQIIKGENRDQAIGRMTLSFKDLAMDLGIPIVVLAQLNRSSEKEGRPLQMSDLRESGNIEQDADRIIFLDPPKQDPFTGAIQDPEDGTSQIYINARQAKGRGDGRHKCGLYFNLPITRMESAINRAAPLAHPPSPSGSSSRPAARRE